MTPWCVLAPLFGFVINAIMAPSRDVALSVEGSGFLMPITAKSVRSWRKIEMGVQKSSIWEAPKLIYSMNERNMVSKNDENR